MLYGFQPLIQQAGHTLDTKLTQLLHRLVQKMAALASTRIMTVCRLIRLSAIRCSTLSGPIFSRLTWSLQCLSLACTTPWAIERSEMSEARKYQGGWPAGLSGRSFEFPLGYPTSH